ncbi:MAG TPA: hypothetical protein VFT60_11270 [Bryobacteraceae bacterium]|jgi:hypothetical protein|nr:hypothetical protein [Bryobacteraceae bacterium]
MSENGSDREIVLGNKQLLAIFFVATLLCGVFFAVGYVVGGNSAKATGSVIAESSTPGQMEGKRDEPTGAAPVSDAMAASSVAGAPDTAGAASGIEPSRMSDNPAAAGSMPPSTTAPSTTAQAAPDTSRKSAPDRSASGPMPISVPEKGASYVQVAAQMRPAAESTAKTLARAGWPTILAESSKADWFEILVGPYRDGVSLADAKRKLIEAGFAGAFVHKQQ